MGNRANQKPISDEESFDINKITRIVKIEAIMWLKTVKKWRYGLNE